ncbi:MAG: hypothetical protein ACI4QR_06895 [Eubacteriales bacterium]
MNEEKTTAELLPQENEEAENENPLSTENNEDTMSSVSTENDIPEEEDIPETSETLTADDNENAPENDEPSDAHNDDTEEAEQLHEVPEEPSEPYTESEEQISSEEFSRVLQNPMFAFFARGRRGSIDEAVRDFSKMLSAGRNSISEEDLQKMTPGVSFGAFSEIALSERQRRIAREAGMSYREYYNMLSSIPAKKENKKI